MGLVKLDTAYDHGTMTQKSQSQALTKRESSEGRRNQIVDVALTLFSELGVHNVSTRRIAEAVGVTQPSLYAHFSSRDQILEAACDLAFERLSDRLREVLKAPPGLDRLRRSFRTYIEFGLQQPDAYRVAFVLESNGQGKDAGETGYAAGQRTFALHREILAAELPPELPEVEFELLAQSLWASLHGLVSLFIARPAFPWAERDALIDRHIELAIAGLPFR